QMGESIAEGTLTRWLKKPGDKVARDEPIFEISTDKVDAEIPSPAAGTLAEVKVQEGQTVPINTVVAQIETEAGAAVAAGKTPPTPEPAAKSAPAAAPAAAGAPSRQGGPTDGRERDATPRRAAPPAGFAGTPPAGAGEIPRAATLIGSGATVEDLRRVRSSPVVRKIAQEHNLDIARIRGSGISGRVTQKDIREAREGGAGSVAAAPDQPDY